MVKVVYVNNFNDEDMVFEKIVEEDKAPVMFNNLFVITKKALVQIFTRLYMDIPDEEQYSKDKDMARSLLDALVELNAHEELNMSINKKPFLVSHKNLFSYEFLGKYCKLEIIENI